MRCPSGVSPERCWLAAVVLGGQGRYAAAAALLTGLLRHATAGDGVVTPAVAAHAAVTLGAHRRQLGGHAAARRWDALGLRIATAACRAGAGANRGWCAVAPDGAGLTGAVEASHATGATDVIHAAHAPGDPGPDPGLDAPAARVDALVGLAADALGTVDLPGAHRLLAAADRLLDAQAGPPPGAATPDAPVPAPRRSPPAGPWRPRVRAHWVRAELALVEGRAADAVGPAEAALALARGAGARRHAVKSRIVLAVARAAADPDAVPEAVAELATAREEAADHRLLPLVWPAALACADLLRFAAPAASSGLHHTAMDTVSILKDYADPVGRRLMGESVWVPRVAVGSLAAPLGGSSPT